MAKMKGKGWRNESRRHSLASKGIKTANKLPNSLKLMKKEDMDRKSLTVMEREIYNKSRALGYDHESAMEEIENINDKLQEELMEINLFETDDELKEQSGGDKWFVTYAQGTKIDTFRSKKEAEKFYKARVKEAKDSYGL